MADKSLGSQDLIGVSKLRSFLQLLVGNLLLLFPFESVALGLLTLSASTPDLILMFFVSLALLVVGILELTNGGELGLLVLLQLGTFVPERVEVLESGVLFSLDRVELLLNLIVLVAQSTGLGVVKSLFQFSDLLLQSVDILLAVVQSGKVLSLLAQAGNVRKSLLLIDQAHATGIDLFLQPSDLLVNLLDTLEGDLAAGVVLLSDTGLEGGVKSIELLLGAGTSRLETLLLLADSRELSTEFLLSLGGGRVLVVGLCALDLGLDLILLVIELALA